VVDQNGVWIHIWSKWCNLLDLSTLSRWRVKESKERSGCFSLAMRSYKLVTGLVQFQCFKREIHFQQDLRVSESRNIHTDNIAYTCLPTRPQSELCRQWWQKSARRFIHRFLASQKEANARYIAACNEQLNWSTAGLGALPPVYSRDQRTPEAERIFIINGWVL